MIVAISGSQGSGKSTVLAELERRGFKVVERKTSRSILDDWGITLQQVNNDPELTMKFQDEITKRKLEDEIALAQSPDLWFTERTHTDLFVYSLASMGKNNNMSEWLDRYYETCKQNNHYYLLNVRLKGGLFNVVHDGVRGSNKHYAEMIDLLMEKYNKLMLTRKQRAPIIDVIDTNERCDLILQYIMTRINKLPGVS